jgi:hypothetical protein
VTEIILSALSSAPSQLAPESAATAR